MTQIGNQRSQSYLDPNPAIWFLCTHPSVRQTPTDVCWTDDLFWEQADTGSCYHLAFPLGVPYPWTMSGYYQRKRYLDYLGFD